jgi:hypothetical protein
MIIVPPLLIIFQWALRAVAFCFLHLSQVADWLWSKKQAEPPNSLIY